jgi:gas vesicle protein
MENSGKTIGALLLGAAIGAVVGVLLAPDKGSETRKKLFEGAKDLTNDLKENAIKFKEKVESFGETAENELKKSVKNKADQYRSASDSYKS